MDYLTQHYGAARSSARTALKSDVPEKICRIAVTA
jgi:hypothetical protein